MTPFFKTALRSFLLPIIIGITCGIILILAFEDSIIYHPSRYPEGNWNTSLLDIPVEDCSFTTMDGAVLHGWFARHDSATWTLLWCHGNAGNITHRLDQLRTLLSLNVHIFIFDYRGYGKSEGKPSEQGLYDDALAAFNYLCSRNDVDSNNIIIYGQSLGSAIAIDLAQRQPCAGIIVEASFPSAKAMAKVMIPWLPIQYFIKSNFDSMKKIASIHAPMLFIHGDKDKVIPLHLGKELFGVANQPKSFYQISGAGHNDCYEVGGEEYIAQIRRFIDKK